MNFRSFPKQPLTPVLLDRSQPTAVGLHVYLDFVKSTEQETPKIHPVFVELPVLRDVKPGRSLQGVGPLILCHRLHCRSLTRRPPHMVEPCVAPGMVSLKFKH